MCAPRLCVKMTGILVGPLAGIMVLNDSDNVVDLFILHQWNPKCLKIYTNIFVQSAPPQTARP